MLITLHSRLCSVAALVELCNSSCWLRDSLKLTLKPPYVDMHMIPGRMGTLMPLLRQSLTKTLHEGLSMKGMLKGERLRGRDLHTSAAVHSPERSNAHTHINSYRRTSV
jgi:hypothetical protein